MLSEYLFHNESFQLPLSTVCVLMCTHTHTCMCVYACVRVCKCMCMFLCVRTRAHVWCVCVHAFGVDPEDSIMLFDPPLESR